MDAEGPELVNIEQAIAPDPLAEAVRQIEQATAAKKCWSCGCLHNTLAVIDRGMPAEHQSENLRFAVANARTRLVEPKYDCLGCEVCYPALAINALNQASGVAGVELEACPTEKVEARNGWPPLPGSYKVLHYRAPVAVCTLTDAKLMDELAASGVDDIALVGTMYTENLGIERLIANVIANPNIRFLVLCGEDTRQTVGHLPGQSLLVLAQNGLDERGRIMGAKGKRPVIKNISREAVERFRHTVEVTDMIGVSNIQQIASGVNECSRRNPGPAERFESSPSVAVLAGYVPASMVSDPSGYVVVYPDRRRNLLYLEHYTTQGVLDVIVEGHSASEVYFAVIGRGLVSRLDHAAYLGRELARAEHALNTGGVYVQDAAPELATTAGVSCGCHSACAQEER